ncbi:MAG TPA: isoleucine--tRNA ligase [Pyrinomonadaceae bacterium]|jgi:isoleucyl-tRNA synthetase|nr:isoleucine--tRNA ligase [Pyrinomonadaceae bacterium]
MDYPVTINLPRTSFPLQGELLTRQEGMLRNWHAQDIYRSILEDRRDARPFIIHDGPPYASGKIHVGIGMNKIIKDIVAKFYTMNDRRVPLVPGWDCHGLPIELEALRTLGPQAAELSVAEFRDCCARYALSYVQEQKRQFQLLGIFADWERPYLTMNPSYEAGVLTILLDMVEKGYVYNDRRPIAWCPHCQIPLAEAEIEYKAAPNRSIWFYLDSGPELTNSLGIPNGPPCSLLVWTTSLWTIPGSVAIAVNPDLQYAAYDLAGKRTVIVQESLAVKAFQDLTVTDYAKIRSFTGKELAGHLVQHPLLNEKIPIILADYVGSGIGSGQVHIVPAHGADDLKAAQENGLQGDSIVDASGNFTLASGQFSGLTLAAGEAAILRILKERGALATAADHEYAHCWRCASPLITQSTRQWFVNLDHRENSEEKTLREKALLEVQIVNWMPPSSQERISGMIKLRPDWCISRQRSWGVPIPAFTCQGCSESILSISALRHVRDLVGNYGSAVWFERSAAELLPPEFTCPNCGAKEFEKEADILDVWFESGTSWQSVLIADHRLTFPADLYVEGSDQHRGWFQLSLLPALVSRGKAPFTSVLTHGFVLNERRERLARARGDFVTLSDALKKIPVDLIRLYFASVDTSRDIPLSIDTFPVVEPQYLRIRGTFFFLLGNLHDFVFHEDSVHLDDLEPLDLWALSRLHELISKVSEDYSGYHFHLVVKKIHDFCNDFLSRLYFDILKDRLYYDAPASQARRSAQTVLHSILMALVKLLAPVLPYTCEEVWALTPGHADCASVHLSRWPKADEQLLGSKKSHDAEDSFARLFTLRKAINASLERLRAAKTIGKNSDAIVRVYAGDGLEAFLGVASLDGLRDFLMVSEIVIATSNEGLAEVPVLPGVSFAVAVSPHQECQRCRRLDVTYGSDPEHPDICARCAKVLRTKDEVHLASGTMVEPSPEMRPADLARYLKQRDVRKLAILNEDGRCRVYALHSPSQHVIEMPELKPLAEYVNRSTDFREHAALLLGLGEHTDVLFGIGIHHLKYGTPLGGTREFAYPRISDMLENMLRLSWGMSVKNAVAELPHGGGKSIIDTCGWDLKVHREFRREVYRDFGQFTATLFGRYICAEDVGNSTADTREMLSACRHVMCLSQGVGGSGNPSRFTALAAWAAGKAGWKFLTGTHSFEGLTIALQGAGNVARNIIPILIEADPGIRKILIADRDPEQIQAIRNILLKQGKESLLEVVSSRDSADNSVLAQSYIERPDEACKDYILYAPCDILIPVAVGKVINPGNVPRLNCRLILPIANNVYSDNDAVATAMLERGIVDVVEGNVNWGGALAAASETYGYDEDNVAHGCIDNYTKTLTLLEAARQQNRPPWFILKEMASNRIFHENHPIVGEARRYKFIGDINQGFNEWIKERWLRNIVDVEPDEFASYAVRKAHF